LEPTDVAENEYSVAHGFRLLSSYKTEAGEKIWIINSYEVTLHQIAEITDHLRRGFETGALKPPPIEIVPFEKAVDAYSRMAAGQAKAKQVLSFD
jgi:D-arabinose 1-dehydrogenase-like Zn-dependent alcohol dehydrogenase